MRYVLWNMKSVYLFYVEMDKSYLLTGNGDGFFWMKSRKLSFWGSWDDLAFFFLPPNKGLNGTHLFCRLLPSSIFLPTLSFKDRGKTEMSVEPKMSWSASVFSCFLLIRLNITWDLSWLWYCGGLGLLSLTWLL